MAGYRNKQLAEIYDRNYRNVPIEKLTDLKKQLIEKDQIIKDITKELLLTEQAIGILGISKEQLENAKKAIKE